MFLRKCIFTLWEKDEAEAMCKRDLDCELEACTLKRIAQMQNQITGQERQLQDLAQQQQCLADLVREEKEISELVEAEQKIQDALRKKRFQHAESLRNSGGHRAPPGLPYLCRLLEDCSTAEVSESMGLTPRTNDTDEFQVPSIECSAKLESSCEELKRANDENDENDDENDENARKLGRNRPHRHRLSGRARQREKKRILKSEAQPRSETI